MSEPLSESRARLFVLALLLIAASILWIAGEAAIQNVLGIGAVAEAHSVEVEAEPQGWQFPNGGDLADHKVVQTPSGAWEVIPGRCTYWEDGSAICPAYEDGGS